MQKEVEGVAVQHYQGVPQAILDKDALIGRYHDMTPVGKYGCIFGKSRKARVFI